MREARTGGIDKRHARKLKGKGARHCGKDGHKSEAGLQPVAVGVVGIGVFVGQSQLLCDGERAIVVCV